MEVFLVGGAVRDELLGRPVRERDWVVVGSTPEEMLRLGFRPVGRDFPVFLHPETGDEYALARTERKTARGYRGFKVYAAPDVTLEDDLSRRDLTINAMARSADGDLIDPHGGARDAEQRILRHVSPAFVEDPVRILRVARFAASLKDQDVGFSVAPETMQLMRCMVDSGEVDALVPERVWQESRVALETDRPDVFFETLRECGALARVYPEVDCLFGIPQPVTWHPEIDTGRHVMMVVRQAARLSESGRVRFAALVHDLGKGVTPASLLPAHHGHDRKGVAIIGALAKRLKIPNDFKELAELVCRYHVLCHRAGDLRPATLLQLLERIDAFRRPERFAEFLLACEADMRGREGFEERDYPQAQLLRLLLDAAAAVRPDTTSASSGAEIGRRLANDRIRAIEAVLAKRQPASSDQ
ncbi:MAG: multifunctional CCA addition/repair protein [Gammaproteobacteria bacterium]|nr:MAG: multifunctional CCA addition/repair protein [Gammaproteobacteria bacterium]